MPAFESGTPQSEFIDVVRQALGDVLSTACKCSSAFEVKDPGAESGNDESGLFFGVAVSGSLQGNASIELSGEVGLTLARKAQGESGSSISELNDDCRKIIKDLLEQIARAVELGLKTRFGDVVWQLTANSTQATEGTRVIFSTGDGSESPFSFVFRLTDELNQSLSSHKATSQASQEVAHTEPRSADTNLDLLRGVNLSLTLRFGQRTLTLREILDLNSGSVVELDRKVQDPADLLLGDKLIARGEVVVVDGNYGIRITEVADPRQGAEGAN